MVDNRLAARLAEAERQPARGIDPDAIPEYGEDGPVPRPPADLMRYLHG